MPQKFHKSGLSKQCLKSSISLGEGWNYTRIGSSCNTQFNPREGVVQIEGHDEEDEDRDALPPSYSLLELDKELPSYDQATIQ